MVGSMKMDRNSSRVVLDAHYNIVDCLIDAGPVREAMKERTMQSHLHWLISLIVHALLTRNLNVVSKVQSAQQLNAY